jgi:hypothetical protein
MVTAACRSKVRGRALLANVTACDAWNFAFFTIGCIWRICYHDLDGILQEGSAIRFWFQDIGGV